MRYVYVDCGRCLTVVEAQNFRANAPVLPALDSYVPRHPASTCRLEELRGASSFGKYFAGRPPPIWRLSTPSTMDAGLPCSALCKCTLW